MKKKREVEKPTAICFVFELGTISVTITNALSRHASTSAPHACTRCLHGALAAEAKEEEEEEEEENWDECVCKGVCGVFVGFS